MKVVIDIKNKKHEKVKKLKQINDTHICILLDRSGSMQSVKDDTIGGLRNFIKEQQKVDGKCTFTLIQFDGQNPHDVLYLNENLHNIDPYSLSFNPRGSTPLLDAIGQAINRTQHYLNNNKSEKVVFVIITDGFENASKEYTRTSIKNLITKKKEKDWKFVFIGANQDAFLTAQEFNIDMDLSINYTQNQIGTGCLYTSLSNNIGNYRSGTVNSVAWTDEDRKAQNTAKT